MKSRKRYWDMRLPMDGCLVQIRTSTVAPIPRWGVCPQRFGNLPAQTLGIAGRAVPGNSISIPSYQCGDRRIYERYCITSACCRSERVCKRNRRDSYQLRPGGQYVDLRCTSRLLFTRKKWIAVAKEPPLFLQVPTSKRMRILSVHANRVFVSHSWTAAGSGTGEYDDMMAWLSLKRAVQ